MVGKRIFYTRDYVVITEDIYRDNVEMGTCVLDDDCIDDDFLIYVTDKAFYNIGKEAYVITHYIKLNEEAESINAIELSRDIIDETTYLKHNGERILMSEVSSAPRSVPYRPRVKYCIINANDEVIEILEQNFKSISHYTISTGNYLIDFEKMEYRAVFEYELLYDREVEYIDIYYIKTILRNKNIDSINEHKLF